MAEMVMVLALPERPPIDGDSSTYLARFRLWWGEIQREDRAQGSRGEERRGKGTSVVGAS
jgi:hypothetical protein